ncbi:MAG: hypothetical protein EOO44_15000 [Flavobacterium sp.]|nr:MAG: hypothetical protein EOO44_15000 [Flavobacterium sp.]
METNVKFNFLTKSYSLIKQAGNFYDELNGIIAFGQYVKVEGKIEVRLYKDFFIFGYKTGSFKGELKLELKSSFGIV